MFIIGTAGHIDHGKTSLVKALTGEDTDRLKEEKERGISIELGFAQLDLPDGTRAGVIDVPGHERFIRTMVAGSHGVDLVLFTVAADDGVMPQTIEHLDILHMLGVADAIFVVTKIDLVSAGRVAELTNDIRGLAAGRLLDGSPVVPYSFSTGAGLDQLRDTIFHSLRRLRKSTPRGYFRLPVDRAFALHGHGLVVTGTALQGEVRAGARVRVLPGGQLFRVRSVQVHGQAVDGARWGQRVALNLSGVTRQSIERGDAICDEQLTMTSDRFDAAVEIRPTATAPVVSHQRIRVHLGTAERLGKLVVLGAAEHIEPGHAALCQVSFADPLHVLRGDRFIIRDETAQRTIGGGVVIHPWPEPHRRRIPPLHTALAALRAGDVASVAASFLDGRAEFCETLAGVSEFLNTTKDETREALRSSSVVRPISLESDELFTTERKWNALVEALLNGLRDFHDKHPLEPGADMEGVREQLPSRLTPKVFRAVVENLVSGRALVREGSLLRLASHTVSLGTAEQRAASLIRKALARAPFSPPDVRQIAGEAGLQHATLLQVMKALEREGSVVRVAADLYFLREAIDSVVRALREQVAEGEEITPALFRERFQTSRKYAIPVLEHLDVEGVTIRIGDRRRLRVSPASTASEASGS